MLETVISAVVRLVRTADLFPDLLPGQASCSGCRDGFGKPRLAASTVQRSSTEEVHRDIHLVARGEGSYSSRSAASRSA
jgi:hypothetical protein